MCCILPISSLWVGIVKLSLSLFSISSPSSFCNSFSYPWPWHWQRGTGGHDTSNGRHKYLRVSLGIHIIHSNAKYNSISLLRYFRLYINALYEFSLFLCYFTFSYMLMRLGWERLYILALVDVIYLFIPDGWRCEWTVDSSSASWAGSSHYQSI